MAQHLSRKLAKKSPGLADVARMTATGPEYKVREIKGWFMLERAVCETAIVRDTSMFQVHILQ